MQIHDQIMIKQLTFTLLALNTDSFMMKQTIMSDKCHPDQSECRVSAPCFTQMFLPQQTLMLFLTSDTKHFLSLRDVKRRLQQKLSDHRCLHL